jgi:hypothetical protein
MEPDERELDLSGEDAPPAKPAEQPTRRARRSSGDAPAPKDTAEARTKPLPGEAELRRRIDEGIDELVSVVRDFLGSETVADSIEADKKRMAETLAAHAIKRATIARWVVRLFGKDSALAAARAFGPTARAVGSSLANRRRRVPPDDYPLEAEPTPEGVWTVPPQS